MATETQETIADIIAELRERGECRERSPVVYDYADRFEAAHKREVQNALDTGGLVEASRKNKQVGNAAKLREALVSVQKKIHYLIGTLNVPNSLVANRMEINGIINAALAAPPRNCDKYSHDEALQVWASEKENERNGCFDEWLYEIAKEGDNK